ncbi:hypothetical protein ACFTAO_49680 [Paenibacillus rhizoplanae]
MNKAAVAKIITTLIMLFFSIVMIVPFLWMISTSFKTPCRGIPLSDPVDSGPL